MRSTSRSVVGMTKRDDDNPDEWLSSGPAAWFIISLTAVAFVGLVAWGFGEFRANRVVEAAIAVAPTDEARKPLREELDLTAQQTMATAAIVATVLSAIIMVFIALTVWFTRNASIQAQKSLAISQRALDETLAASRREIMPYLVAQASCSNIHDVDEIDSRTRLIIVLSIKNFGQTPCYIKYIRSYIKEKDEIHEMAQPRRRPVRKTIASQETCEIIVAFFSAAKAWSMRESTEYATLYIQIVSGDIFYDDREDHLKYIINSVIPMSDDGNLYGDAVTLELRPDSADNPLRSWIGTMDGGIKYDPSVKKQL